ncbi:hypothetical protein E4K72_13270 [Oxalobacteraceae bacterium OM1]|nr:hypothetical protein E4K72_13270 [Oxalobacteraceae bacterium OM1]
MEVHLHSERWGLRAPHWGHAAASGFIAGAVMMVLELLWNTGVMGTTPWEISHMVAAIVLGPDALTSNAFSVGVVGTALVVHYALGIVFGIVLAWLLVQFHYDTGPGATLTAGAVFGAVLYGIDFYLMAAVFPWFVALRGGATLLCHVVFGMIAAGLYWSMNEA